MLTSISILLLFFIANSSCSVIVNIKEGINKINKQINKINKNKLKKTGLVPLLDLFREGERRVVWFQVCESLLDGWANGGSVDVFFTYGEYGLSSFGI